MYASMLELLNICCVCMSVNFFIDLHAVKGSDLVCLESLYLKKLLATLI